MQLLPLLLQVLSMYGEARCASLFRCGLLLNACASGVADAEAERTVPFLWDGGEPIYQVRSHTARPSPHLESPALAHCYPVDDASPPSHQAGPHPELRCPLLACASASDHFYALRHVREWEAVAHKGGFRFVELEGALGHIEVRDSSQTRAALFAEIAIHAHAHARALALAAPSPAPQPLGAPGAAPAATHLQDEVLSPARLRGSSRGSVARAERASPYALRRSTGSRAESRGASVEGSAGHSPPSLTSHRLSQGAASTPVSRRKVDRTVSAVASDLGCFRVDSSERPPACAPGSHAQSTSATVGDCSMGAGGGAHVESVSESEVAVGRKSSEDVSMY